MFEVATSLTELIPNLLDPLAYVLGILGNVYGYRKMAGALSKAADSSPAGEDEASLLVRIGLAGPGQVPRYRIETDGAEVVGVFDGRNHEAVEAERARRVRWGDKPIPAGDVENLAVVLRWLGTTGNIHPVPPDTN
jgi:hypothetical protein